MLKTPIIQGRNFAFNKNGESHCISNFKEYENTLKDLKPVAIDTLFKNGKTPQEISNGIKKIFPKITQFNVIFNLNFKKKTKIFSLLI